MSMNSQTPRTDALEQALYQADSCLVTEPTFPEMMDFARQLERELAEEKARFERMMDAEQERLLLASEDDIRKEILAAGRDPAEYLKAVDKVMKLIGENALLKHALKKARADAVRWADEVERARERGYLGTTADGGVDDADRN